MKKIICYLFILNTVIVYSLQWPVENLDITSTFGEKMGDYYLSGIDIGGGEQDVVSVSEGRVVYYHEEDSPVSDLPSGLGSFIVIEHERSLKTSYAHLKKGSVLKNRPNVNRGEKIGVIGDTGASSGKLLHFEVVDGELNQIVNPLKLLSERNDKSKPIIKNIYLKLADSEKRALSGRREKVQTGNYSLFAQVYDICETSDYFCPTAPYSISVYLNGEEVIEVLYDSLVIENGKMVMSSNSLTADKYYISEDDWTINIGEINLIPGTIRLELSVKDFAGNETTRYRLLTVYR
jgi:Peptidase family M23